MPHLISFLSTAAIRPVLLGVLVLITIPGTACQSTGSARQTSSLDTAITAYERRDFRQAQIYADLARKGPDAENRQKAAYVAGLAAWNLDEETEARVLFLDAQKASNRAAAGGANAMLGQIALDESRYRQAATHFEIAAEKLREPDASKARRWATTARRLAGISTSPATTKSGPWSIQFGAFASETRAKRVQNRLVKNPNVIRLGHVQVISSNHGDGLYLVQMGTYEDRGQAISDRDKLSSLGCIVVPLAGR